MDNIRKIVRSTILESLDEVRHINSRWPAYNNEKPIKDTETIKVYHGFNKFEDVANVLKIGLSGQERAKRIYSYEYGNNPKGLFVSVDFDVVTRSGFAHSGVIIEFNARVSDLEAPVWVGGRSYFVPGEYTKSFKDADEREQQRLVNRAKESNSDLERIAKSDRPELAATIFENGEKQALFIGNLNPNMINSVWYNEILHKQRRTNGSWERMSRKEFIRKLGVDTKRGDNQLFLPNDDFSMEKMIKKYWPNPEDNWDLKSFIKRFPNFGDDRLQQMGFFPKQIQQMKSMLADGSLDQYRNL